MIEKRSNVLLFLMFNFYENGINNSLCFYFKLLHIVLYILQICKTYFLFVTKNSYPPSKE